MRSKVWICAGVACLLASSLAFADHDHDGDHDRGHGRGHEAHYREAHDRDARYAYDDHDRDRMRSYYHDHYRHLPPGLAKRDRLPPGLERRLRAHYVMDTEMISYMRPCPRDLEEELPPPPPHCAHTIIGGHIVLVNNSTHVVLDVFHLDR